MGTKKTFREVVQEMASATPEQQETMRRDLRYEIDWMLHRGGVTRQELANALGCHVQTVYNFLSGKTAIPYRFVEKILWLLDWEKRGEEL